MPNLSPLQLLPRHVVQIIVNHIVGSSRMVYAGIRLGTEEYKSLLEPLLSVCRNFRVVANSLYHHRFRLNIDQRSAELKTRGKYPAQHHLAKNLVIDLNEASVYSGETLKALSEAPYDSCVFPLDELPAYVTATYSPVGKRFRCWHLGDYMVLNYQELIKCVLLLALACPNFDCVVLPSYMYRPFMKSIEETIATDAFKQYAPRLRRLLY
ncbi:hypothetical protein GGI20_003526 [Coemansia sp. BCRC 34301]|nr:hypothetical protein GGI20_003526 [Coemansia sp. BCRC 34301]